MTSHEVVGLTFVAVTAFGLVVAICVIAFIVVRDALHDRTRG